MTHIFVMQNYTKLANSYFITMLSDSSISCYHFASSRVWQKSTRCRACKAVFRPLLHCYYLYIVKEKSRACTWHTPLTSLHNQSKPMQPNILLLIAFTEVNVRCSCSLVEDIKNKQLTLKIQLINRFTSSQTLYNAKMMLFPWASACQNFWGQINKISTDKRECKSFSVHNRSFPASL